MSKLLPDDAHAFIAKMDNELIPFFRKCVVPIYAEQYDSPVQCGTGTLLRVSNVSLLVTASHIADIRAIHHYQLYITDTPQGSKPVALEGDLHQERNLDVAVWRLADRVVAELPKRRFLTVHHGDRSRSRLGKGWYYVHGYPNCWSNPQPQDQKITVEPFTYGTILYDGPTGTFLKYDPESHVLLTAPKNDNVDTHGSEAKMPTSLEGISGCSLWQAYYEGLDSSSWIIDDATIVAVQTGTYRKGTVVKGTCWCFVNEIIRRAYPELEQPLSIITPHKRVSRSYPCSSS